MRELRIKVDIVVPLPDGVVERAERTLALTAEVDKLGDFVGDGFIEVDVREVIAKTRPRMPRPAPEPTPIERAAAAAAQDSDEERASDHPIMGDAPGGEDLLAIPPELDRRVPRRAPGDAG